MLKVERIEKNGRILAIILRSSKSDSPVEFVTPKEFPLQLGVHKRKKKDYVNAHEHTAINNLKNLPIQEIFFLKKGKILVGLYDDKKLYKNVKIFKGDIILLNTGNSVRFLEDTDMVEVKQGPYAGAVQEKKSIS